MRVRWAASALASLAAAGVVLALHSSSRKPAPPAPAPKPAPPAPAASAPAQPQPKFTAIEQLFGGRAQSFEDELTGTWYDASGQPWQVVGYVLDQGKSYMLLRGDAAAGARPSPGLFGGFVAGSPIKDGIFTTTCKSWDIRNVPPPDLVYDVDTRTGGALIVVASHVDRYSGSGKILIRGVTRFELTREKDLLARPAPAEPRSAAELAAALEDPDWTVRREAIREIGAHGGPGAVDQLLAVLRDPFFTNKRLAIRGLGRLKAHQAIPALVSCLESGQNEISQEAAATLQGFGPGITEELLSYLERTPLEPAWQSPAVDGGDGVRPPAARPDHYDPHYRMQAIARLCTAWGPAAIPAVRRALAAGKQDTTYWMFTVTLPQMKGEAAADAVLAYLDPAEPPAQKQVPPALIALGRIGHPKAISVLCGYFRYAEAGESLVQIGPASLPAVLDMVGSGPLRPTGQLTDAQYAEFDHERRVRSLVFRLAPQDPSALLARHRAEKDPARRIRFADMLGCVKTDAAVAELAEDARSPHLELRAIAAESLGLIGSKPACDRLADLLRDRDDRVFLAAVTGLARERDPRFLAPAIARIKVPGLDRVQLYAASRCLAAIREARLRESIPALVEFCAAPAENIRRDACQALRATVLCHGGTPPGEQDNVAEWWHFKGGRVWYERR